MSACISIGDLQLNTSNGTNNTIAPIPFGGCPRSGGSDMPAPPTIALDSISLSEFSFLILISPC